MADTCVGGTGEVDIGHEEAAKLEIKALVAAAKKKGKGKVAVSTLALARISEEHLLERGKALTILSGIWANYSF